MRLRDFHRRGWKSVAEQETRPASLNNLAASVLRVTVGE